jgi:hypothetical protein
MTSIEMNPPEAQPAFQQEQAEIENAVVSIEVQAADIVVPKKVIESREVHEIDFVPHWMHSTVEDLRAHRRHSASVDAGWRSKK